GERHAASVSWLPSRLDKFRLQDVLPDLFIDDPDMTISQQALPIDDIGFRRAIDTQIKPESTRLVEKHETVGITKIAEPCLRLVTLILVVEPDDSHALCLQLAEVWMCH